MEVSRVVELAVDEAATVSLPWEWAISKGQVCFRSVRALRPAASTA
jgi:hypothetical protein